MTRRSEHFKTGLAQNVSPSLSRIPTDPTYLPVGMIVADEQSVIRRGKCPDDCKSTSKRFSSRRSEPISSTQEHVFLRDRMIITVRPQDLLYVRLKPLLWGGQVLDIIVHRRLDAKERDLVVSLQIERISSVDVVPVQLSDTFNLLERIYEPV